MTNTPLNVNQTPQVHTPLRTPGRVASTVGVYVRVGLTLLLWIVVGSAGIAACFVALRGIWFAAQLALRALGV